MDPAGEVAVCGEDGSEVDQEGEGGAGRCRGHILCVRGGSEALDPIRVGGGGKPLEIRPAIYRGGGWC